MGTISGHCIRLGNRSKLLFQDWRPHQITSRDLGTVPYHSTRIGICTRSHDRGWNCTMPPDQACHPAKLRVRTRSLYEVREPCPATGFVLETIPGSGARFVNCTGSPDQVIVPSLGTASSHCTRYRSSARSMVQISELNRVTESGHFSKFWNCTMSHYDVWDLRQMTGLMLSCTRSLH